MHYYILVTLDLPFKVMSIAISAIMSVLLIQKKIILL
jgi:hypothetical protein